MKLIKLLPVLMMVAFVSCKKEHLPNVEETKVEALLAGKQWRMGEISFVDNNELYHYLRGASGNTANFDNNVIFFKADGTGTYTDGAGIFATTWVLNQNDRTKLTYTIYDYDNNTGSPKPGSNAVIQVENLHVSKSELRYSEIYYHNDHDYIISVIKRIL